jgi:hypothetical protein
MEHGAGRSTIVIVLALVAAVGAALASCGETAKKQQPDAPIDTPSGSASPCTLDTSKLDNCTL